MDNVLRAAYDECLNIAHSHYENFPVASWLVPARLRIHVATIYAFARHADDLADEGDDPAEQRILSLQLMGKELNNAVNGEPADHFLYIALANTIKKHQLDPQLFHDLLDAFTQDVVQTRYASFADVLDYCRRSANPVGRLMLQLFDESTKQNNHDSDLICSALQLINFMQDIQQDLIENDRVYFPLDEMTEANISIDDLKKRSNEPHIVKFVHEQTRRAQQMLLGGSGLGKRLRGRFGMEIRTIISGGLRICDALLNQGDNVYSRPRLTTSAKIGMLKDALFR